MFFLFVLFLIRLRLIKDQYVILQVFSMSEMKSSNAFVRRFGVTEERRGPEVKLARPLGTIADGQRPSADFNFGIKGQSLIAMTSRNDPMSRVVGCRTT